MTTAKRSLLILVVAVTCGCTGMSQRQQSTLSGGAMGAGGGALLGAVTGGSPAVGAAVGGAAGALGGYIVGGQHDKR
ncbi:glycine zipper domain-containing protein [Geomonas sp. RF6]|uniref:YMGG-like glycine zipper-containing protein n=1 Tax=Geomonas sp. RF6 TaxID=2897342 RepID=UPI001E5BEC7B|nr:YMGG-like glycine zipper-containing protein [Geomonas sp. RF6]UFS69222.1 glycine zipper domain-containing protein [Geomonas sp. RF6]